MATIEMKTLKFANDTNTYKVVDGDALHYSQQTLTDSQKEQALNNIGAANAIHEHSQYYPTAYFLYSSTQPTGTVTGQIWLKPVS